MIRIKALALWIAEHLLRVLWLLPMRDQVLFICYGGRQFSDSPRTLYLKYQEHKSPKRLLWAADSAEAEQRMRARGLETVRTGTLRYLRAFTGSATVITNCHVSTYLPVRKRQTVINTWHGSGPLKTMGFDDPHSTEYDRVFFRVQNRKYAAFVSGCAFNTDVLYRRSFGYGGTVLEWGLPRNAVLYADRGQARAQVMKALGISPEGDPFLVLYAPTFRGTVGSASLLPGDMLLRPEDIARAVSASKGRRCVCLFRGHHAMTAGGEARGFVDASGYGDMQDLLCAADALITDYSSCMTDMALTRRPVVLYVPDRESYLRDRGMYRPMETLPFPLCSTQDEVIRALTETDRARYDAALDRFFESIGLAEGPDSDERVYRYLEEEGTYPPGAVIGRVRRSGV